MAKKKRTKVEQEYYKLRKQIQSKQSYEKRKYGLVPTELPKIPQKITKQSIKELKREQKGINLYSQAKPVPKSQKQFYKDWQEERVGVKSTIIINNLLYEIARNVTPDFPPSVMAGEWLQDAVQNAVSRYGEDVVAMGIKTASEDGIIVTKESVYKLDNAIPFWNGMLTYIRAYEPIPSEIENAYNEWQDAEYFADEEYESGID